VGYPYPPQQQAWPPPQPYAAPQNPYAAPYASPWGAGGPWSGPLAEPGSGNWIKWAYAGSLAVMVLLVVAGIAIMPDGNTYDPDYDQDMADLGGALAGIGMMFWLVRLIFAFVWINQAWSAIPFPYRMTSSGKQVSPGSAVGLLFVPIFNLYWMFVVSAGLSDAMGSALASTGSYRQPAKGLAITGCVMQLIPYVNLILAPFIWFFFMFSVDGAKREMLERLRAQQQQQGQGAQGPMGYGAPAPGYPAPYGAPAPGPYGQGPYGY
jgi:hypothetical protein